jgi:Cu/Ag efflux pump CusA
VEEGEDPIVAAEKGTLQVAMAVVATTSVVIAVFLPIGFLSGMVGQFFKQLGFTVCFAMAVSLVRGHDHGPDALGLLGEEGRHARREGGRLQRWARWPGCCSLSSVSKSGWWHAIRASSAGA